MGFKFTSARHFRMKFLDFAFEFTFSHSKNKDKFSLGGIKYLGVEAPEVEDTQVEC